MNEDQTEKPASNPLATILSGGALVTIGKVFALGFGFLTQIVMARLLPETAYGNLVLTLSIVSIVELVGKLGLNDGVMREYPRYEDTPSKAYGIIRSSLTISLISGTLIFVGLYISAPYIARNIFDNPSLVPLLRIGAISLPFLTTQSIGGGLVRGARDARVLAYVGQIFQPAARLMLIGALLLGGYGAIGALTGHTFSLILAALATFYLTYRILPSYEVVATPMYRSVLAFSLPLIAVQGMGFLNSNVDVYMVGYFLSSADLGVYNVSLQLSNVVISIIGTAGFLLPPMMTRLQQEEKYAEMRRTFQLLTKWMVVLILPIFVVLFFAPELIIGLSFGGSYTGGALALRILLVGNLIAIVMGLNSQALIALGHNRIVSYIVFCQTAVNIIVNYTLIPVIGFEGAAIGMTLSAIIGDGLGVTILYRRSGVHPFTRSVLSPVGAVLGIGLLGYGILSVVGLPTYLTVLIVGIAYLPIVVTLAPEPEDEELLSRVEDQTGYDLSVIRRIVTSVR